MNLTRSLQNDKLDTEGELRAPGWHSRGYLPHFDGGMLPQFITLHLADSLPKGVLERWQIELAHCGQLERKVVLRQRIDRYLDAGYGECWLKDSRIARMVQTSLLVFDRLRYDLFAWVVMPNHTHSLLGPHEGCLLARLMHSHKSYTAHEANRILNRTGPFWMKEYFDRYIRNADHFGKTVRYIEDNPVEAGLCSKASDWPFSSAWFRAHRAR